MKITRTWFPDAGQVFLVRGESSSYLHSLWVGLTAPFLNLPIMIWNLILKPMVFGFITIVSFFGICIIFGLSGYARGASVSNDK